MRFLRASCYVAPGEPPFTTVADESAFIDTLESVRYQHHVPGALVVHDIFEMPNDDLHAATEAAKQRAQDNALDEQNMALLYFWTAKSWGPPLREGGTIFQDKPAPLTREQIATVFEQLAEHPEYKNFTIVSHTRDGEPVELVAGKITEPEGH